MLEMTPMSVAIMLFETEACIVQGHEFHASNLVMAYQKSALSIT